MDDYRRGSRCPACRLTPGLCLCDSLPRIELPFRLIVIQHIKESGKLSNTGSLAHRLLAGSELHVYGKLGACIDAGILADPSTDYFVLFPGPCARELTPSALAPRPGRRAALVALDARWGQARRMSRRVPGILGHPTVTLPGDAGQSFQFRTAPRAGFYSTIDAVTLAIRCAGHPDAAERIEAELNRIRPRTMHLRGYRRRKEIGG